MPTTLLTLICHGATRAVRDAAFPLDEPLDGPGLAAAQGRARSLRRVDAALTSPALRARQTAEALGLEARVETALRDLDCGAWAGRSLADVAEADPGGAAAWMTDAAAAPHGGEPVEALLRRVADWLRVAAGWEGRTVAVTHAAVVRAAIVGVLKAPAPSFWRIDVAPLGSVQLRGGRGGWTLVAMTQ